MRTWRRLFALILALALLPALPWASAEEKRGYAIEVDITNQIVTIYDAETREVVRQTLCSSGVKGYTPLGEFKMAKTRSSTDRKPWYKIEGVFVRYATRIRGEILFHSVPYLRRSVRAINPDEAEKLGVPASHGCVRLRWQDAWFIAKNCPPGTPVRIYKSEQPDAELRKLLRSGPFDAGRGVTYERFLGSASEPGALGRGDAGEEVLRLQTRLRELGIFDGEPDGAYGTATVDAVRLAQYLMDADMSGSATLDLQTRIYADDAPTATNLTLSEGMSGPAVTELCRNLAALRLYGEAPGQVYDAAVAEAVRALQSAYGYEATGLAAPLVQMAAAFEAERLAERFGGADYDCQRTEGSLWLGRVEAESGMKLRKGPSRSSKILRELLLGDALVVLEPGKEWTKVRIDGDVGYVKNSLVSFRELKIGRLRYTAGEAGLPYVIGGTAEEYGAGQALPREALEAQAQNDDPMARIRRLAGYVTVNTRGAADALNLRADSDAGSDVLDTVPDGTCLRVRERLGEWTLVRYHGQEGYLLNRYLDERTGLEEATEEPAGPTTQAVVRCAVGVRADVFAGASEDARLLGSVVNGTAVEVLERREGWCAVRYEDGTVYMLEEDLQLR